MLDAALRSKLGSMHIARALRFAGYPLVLAVGEPLWMRPFSSDHHIVGTTGFPAWAAAYMVFAVSFHVSASVPESARVRRLCMLGLMTLATLTMATLITCPLGALSLVVLASQAALVLSRRQTAVFVATETLVLYAVTAAPEWGEGALSHLLGLVAAEMFAAIAVHLARHAAETAHDLGLANAELRGARSLLEETSRANERGRLARELHDVLGHDLTALGLQLEVATHLPPDRAALHVATAQEVTARLLRNVREVAMELRDGPAIDLVQALQALARGAAPGLAVHLAKPDDLRVVDGARGHCILRCTQEIVTNALRHARAQNLWITIAVDAGSITLEAHDDGRGATEVRAGQGLAGMRARLEELGGRLSIGVSVPGSAFAVSAWLPTRDAAS